MTSAYRERKHSRWDKIELLPRTFQGAGVVGKAKRVLSASGKGQLLPNIPSTLSWSTFQWISST